MKALAFSLLLFAVVPSWAQENLEPDDAPFITGHASRLFGRDYARNLKPEIGKDVRIFAVIEGGLVPDFAVGLKKVKGDYRIFMLAEKHGGGLERCEAPIANALAMDIIIAWDKVLRQARVRTSRPMGGADVPFYHFGSRLPSGLVMGRVWDTSPTSNPAQLGRIAGGLLEICGPEKLEPASESLAGIRIALKAIH